MLTLIQFAFRVSIGVIDILTDLILIALPIQIVGHLQMVLEKKLVVASAFAFRIL